MDWLLKASSTIKKLYSIAAVICLAFISACGSGGFNENQGDGSSSSVTVTLSISNANVSAASPATVTATVLDGTSPKAGVVVTFTSTLGSLNPSNGTALTDSSGQANIQLLAGTTAGAATVTGTVESGELGTVGFTTQGDEVSNEGKQVALSFVGGSSHVSAATPLTINAVVTEDGQPVSGEVLTFSTSFGSFIPASGTALTDGSGMASIILTAGSTEGASSVTVSTSTGEQSTLGYTTSGDDTASLVAVTISLLNPSGQATSNVSTSNPGTLQAMVTSGGLPAAGVLVTFSLNGSVGQLNPESGTALTDNDGIATIILQAGNTEGAGLVTATLEGGISETKAFQVAISATDVAMSSPTITPGSIGANGTATVEVTITETTDNVTTPLSETATVQFTSECVQLGTALIDTDVDTIAGVARATYKDKGCGKLDTINISTTIGQTLLTQSGLIDVQPADAGSIEFLSASPANIALQGTGGSGRSETSTVTFRVIDSIGNPVRDTQVDFTLTTSVGGLTISPTSGQTNSDGEIDVIVQSGTIPTPVRVVASLASDNTISTVSDELVISTGVADYNSLSLSASVLNPEGWNIDGVTSTITARVADHFNNPVPDGTAVSFTAEFGAIDPSCVTTNGECFVIWRSQAPRVDIPAFRDTDTTASRQLGDINDPNRSAVAGECRRADGSDTNLNAAYLPCHYSNYNYVTTTTPEFHGGLGQVYGNRLTIRATVLGEESFNDANANGQFDSGEAFTDLTEAFSDYNEDGVFGGKLLDGSPSPGAATADAKCYGTGNTFECFQVGGDNEEFVDFNSNQTFDLGNNLYNGVLCPIASEAAGICSRELLTIWKEITLLQAGSGAYIGLIQSGLDRTDANNYFLTTALPATFIAYVADLHNGLMPAGTTISFEAGNGKVVGPTSCTVGNSSAFAISACAISINTDDESDSGPLVVTVTTPGGNGINGTSTTTSITITD